MYYVRNFKYCAKFVIALYKAADKIFYMLLNICKKRLFWETLLQLRKVDLQCSPSDNTSELLGFGAGLIDSLLADSN